MQFSGGVTVLLLGAQPHKCRVPCLTVITYLLGFPVQTWTGLGTEGPQATALSRQVGGHTGKAGQRVSGLPEPEGSKHLGVAADLEDDSTLLFGLCPWG